MVYAYNLPNLGYGYDQYYSSSSYSSYSSQNHHHVGPGFDALLRGDASTPHLGGAHRSSSMPKDPFGNVDLSSHVVAALNATGHTQRYDVNHDTMFQTPNSQCFVKPIEETPVGAMASECFTWAHRFNFFVLFFAQIACLLCSPCTDRSQCTFFLFFFF